MGSKEKDSLQMKTVLNLKLIIKHKKSRPVELAIYSMDWLKDEGAFLMPLFENRLPQMFFDKSIQRITRKLKGFKLYMVGKKQRRYL
jgi:hypothetical protein